MDKRSILGFALIALIVIGYTLLNQPSAEEVDARKRQADSLRTVAEQQAAQAEKQLSPTPPVAQAAAEVAGIDSISSDSVQEVQLAEQFGVFAKASQGEKEYVTIQNDLIRAKVSTKGGHIAEVELLNYKTYDQKKLLLFDEDSSSYSFSFMHNSRFYNTLDLFFTAEKKTLTVNGDNAGAISLRLESNDPSKYIEYVYSLNGNSYQIDYTVNVVGLPEILMSNVNNRDLSMNWKMKALRKEKGVEFEKTKSSVYYKYKNEDRDYLSETSDDKENLESDAQWIAYKQQFFSAIIMSKEGFPREGADMSITVLESPKYTKEYETNLVLPINNPDNARAEMSFYFGPNDYDLLTAYDQGMDKIIDLGWGIFGWMNEYLVIPIFGFLDSLNWNYGLIILVLTIIIKGILFPLTYKNYKSSAKMRVLKPEIDALNEKHKNDDPMKKQQATMALYKKTGVNPMAGCVPMLIQLPILYAMFRFFPASLELRQESFLWADDLSAYDSILELPFSIPFYGDHVSLFCILMAASSIIYTKMNSGQMAGGQMPQMKVMMYFFPIMLLFFFNSFPAGLSYYYFLANLITIAQILIIKRFFLDEDAIRAKLLANQKKPKKKSGFQARLEKMAKEKGYKAPSK